MESPLLYRYLAMAVVGSFDRTSPPLLEVRLRMAGLPLVHLEWQAEAEAVVLSRQETEVGAEFSCFSAHVWNQGRWIVLH